MSLDKISLYSDFRSLCCEEKCGCCEERRRNVYKLELKLTEKYKAYEDEIYDLNEKLEAARSWIIKERGNNVGLYRGD